MLKWDPAGRVSAADALASPYLSVFKVGQKPRGYMHWFQGETGPIAGIVKKRQQKTAAGSFSSASAKVDLGSFSDFFQEAPPSKQESAQKQGCATLPPASSLWED